jgi:hypothetical protein
MQLEELIDQKVTLHGTARNAKGGPVIITKDNNVIYFKNLESWPPELEGKQIIMSGLLKKEKFIPDPIIDENGAISCGAKGMQFVLENAEYSVKI